MTRRHVLYRLFGFNATSGAVSIAGNLLFVSLLIRAVHASLLVANLLAVAGCSLLTLQSATRLFFAGGVNPRKRSRRFIPLQFTHRRQERRSDSRGVELRSRVSAGLIRLTTVPRCSLLTRRLSRYSYTKLLTAENSKT